jgi:HK97 family phage prohead protease
MTMTTSMVKTDGLVRMTQGEYGLIDGNTLYGYLSVFNQDTEINSAYEGHFMERIAPGAFARTLERRGHRVKILFNHGLDPHIGDKPLGKPSVLREDDHGLYVEVPLDDTSYNADLRASLKSGSLDGMSFRFSIPSGGATWDDDTGGLPQRTVNEVILHEGGPVTFPAYEGAAAGLRSTEDYMAWRAGLQVITTSAGNNVVYSEPEHVADTSTDSPPQAPVENRAIGQAEHMATILRSLSDG